MKLLTPEQAGKRLGISRQRVNVLIAAGRLPATRVGRSWIIEPSALAAVRVRRPGRPKKRDDGDSPVADR